MVTAVASSNTAGKAPIELSNLATGAVLNILEISTLGQPFEVQYMFILVITAKEFKKTSFRT